MMFLQEFIKTMRCEVKISEQADFDLRNIYEYIAFTLFSPSSASGILLKLQKCILNLDNMPNRYPKYQKEPWKSIGLRVAVVGNYSVFYIVDDKCLK